jgi:hypothetical protein
MDEVKKYLGLIWFKIDTNVVRQTFVKRAIFRKNFEELVIDFDYVDDDKYHYTVTFTLSGPDVYSGKYNRNSVYKNRNSVYKNSANCTILRDKNKIFSKGSWFEDNETFEWGCELYEVTKFSDEK